MRSKTPERSASKPRAAVVTITTGPLKKPQKAVAEEEEFEPDFEDYGDTLNLSTAAPVVMTRTTPAHNGPNLEMFARPKPLPPPPSSSKPRNDTPVPPLPSKATVDLDAALAAKSHQHQQQQQPKEVTSRFTLAVLQEKEKKATAPIVAELPLPTGTKEPVIPTTAAISILGGTENQSSNTSATAAAMDLSTADSKKEDTPSSMNVFKTAANRLKSVAAEMMASSSAAAAVPAPEKEEKKRKRKRDEDTDGDEEEDEEIKEPPKKKEKKEKSKKKKSSSKKDKKDKKKKKKEAKEDGSSVPIVQEKAESAVPIDEAKATPAAAAVDPFESKMDESSSSGGTTGAKIKPSDPSSPAAEDEPEKKKKKKKFRPAIKSTAMKKSLRQQGIDVIDAQPMAGKGTVTPKRFKYANKRGSVIGSNCDGLTRPAIRRLARRGGVKRISDDTYEAAQTAQRIFLELVIRDAVLYTEHARRKTVTTMDVIYSLKRQGKTLFPTGGLFGRKTNSKSIRKQVAKVTKKIEKEALAAGEKKKKKRKKTKEDEASSPSAATTTENNTTVESPTAA
jgi:histone H4